MKLRNCLFIAASLSYSQVVFADASPWMASAGEFDLGISQVEQSADDFYQADQKVELDSELSLSTTSLTLKYGISDEIGLDVSVGYASSDFGGAEDRSGVSDSKIGLTWQFINEFVSVNNLPSTAIRLGAIIDGDYETGQINSIGDGGNGYEI